MADIIQPEGAGGFAIFRVFGMAVDGEVRVALTALGAGRHTYTDGVQVASCSVRPREHKAAPFEPGKWDWDFNDPNRVPVATCSCGFWGYKNHRELVTNLGDDDAVLGLIEAGGKVIETEIGARAEFARIVAVVRPPEDEGAGFPEAAIRASYPGVTITSLGRLGRVIKQEELTVLKRTPPPPYYQYLDSAGVPAWDREFLGSSAQGNRLPPAATHPDEVLADHGLVKDYLDTGGALYAYWRRADIDGKREDRQAFHALVDHCGMQAHVVEE